MTLLAIKDNKIANAVLFYCTLPTHQIEIKKAEHTDLMKDIDVILNIPGESKNCRNILENCFSVFLKLLSNKMRYILHDIIYMNFKYNKMNLW